MFNNLINLIRNDGSIIINKTLAKNIGLNETIIYSELVSKYKYWMDRESLTEDGFFYCTVEDMEDSSTLGEKPQARAIKTLVNLGLIEYQPKRKAKGQDGKTMRHFKIVDDVNLILSLLGDKAKEKAEKQVETVENTGNLHLGGCGNSNQAVAEPPFGRTNNTIYNNTNINKNNNKTQQHTEPEVVVVDSPNPPTTNNDIPLDSEVYSTYLDAYGDKPNNITKRAINRYMGLLDVDTVLFAMEESGTKGKKWDYAMGMLNKWIASGCKDFMEVVVWNENNKK